MGKFYICSCFYTRNIFLKRLNVHVEYYDKDTFLQAYRQVLQSEGITTAEDQQHLITEIEAEVSRRKRLGQNHLERKWEIHWRYSRKHADIYSLQRHFLAAEFKSLVEYCETPDATFEGVCDRVTETNIERAYATPVFTPDFCRLFLEEIQNYEASSCPKGRPNTMNRYALERAYAMPVFTADFCRRFLEEIQNFEASNCPKGRPNTMNRYGVLLDELGFDQFMTELRERYLRPITRLLYPDWGGGELDSHKAFVVQYKMDQDLDLNYHYDNAEVTLNVSLSPSTLYSRGNLYFGPMQMDRSTTSKSKQLTTFQHRPNMGLLHRGQHMHGASEITSGERYNLVVWMRSSKIRNRLCPMCDREPDIVETCGFGDGFTAPDEEVVNVCTIE